MNSSSQTSCNPLTLMALCGVATYLLISWTLPEVYPFSPMAMYAGKVGFPVERLLLTDHEQYVVPPDELRTVQCWPKVDLESPSLSGQDEPRTAAAYHIPYLDKELGDAIHWEAFSVDVVPELTLVRRRFFVDQEGIPSRTADTMLSRCVGVADD